MNSILILVFVGIFAISSSQQDSCREMINQMNSYRARHRDTPPLKCNDKLSKKIQEHIDYSTNERKIQSVQSLKSYFESREFLKNSENEEQVGITTYFAEIKDGQPTKTQGQIDAVHSWYSQESCYDYENPKLGECKEICKETFTHEGQEYRICTVLPIQFTQLVWKNSTDVGVGSGILKSQDEEWFFLAAIYTPAGNLVMDTSEGVMPRL